MLTDMGHYGLFKLPKYRTVPEWCLFIGTVVTVVALVVKWFLL